MCEEKSLWSTQTLENTSQARAAGFNVSVVKQFVFENLNSLYVCHQFGPARIWNCEKLDFQLLYKPMLLPKKEQSRFNKLSTERGKNVTLLCFVSANGETIFPLFVSPCVKAPERMF